MLLMIGIRCLAQVFFGIISTHSRPRTYMHMCNRCHQARPPARPSPIGSCRADPMSTMNRQTDHKNRKITVTAGVCLMVCDSEVELEDIG